MTKLVMIRGCSGTGKTTLMRSFIAHHGLKLRTLGDIAYMGNSRYAVLGDYTLQGCVGCDRYKNISDIKLHLSILKDALAPDVVLFEHMLLSTTYKYTCELIRIYGKDNFGCIFLDVGFNDIVRNIAKRNDGKKFSYDNVMKNFMRARRAYAKLVYGGVYGLRVDPFRHSGEPYMILDGFITDWKSGKKEQKNVQNEDKTEDPS